MKYKNIHSECKRGFSNDSSSRCCAARSSTVWRVQSAISLCLRRVLWSLFGSEAGMGKEGVFFLFPQTDRDTVQYVHSRAGGDGQGSSSRSSFTFWVSLSGSGRRLGGRAGALAVEAGSKTLPLRGGERAEMSDFITNFKKHKMNQT